MTVLAKAGSGASRGATSNLPTPKSLARLDWAATSSGAHSNTAMIDRGSANLNLMTPILRFSSIRYRSIRNRPFAGHNRAGPWQPSEACSISHDRQDARENQQL